MKPALLLVNLGTPEAPDARAVDAYLSEFLLDPRVVAIPRWIWKPLLKKVILPRRCGPVAEKYRQIWLPEGSPLKVWTARLAEAMAARLPGHTVDWAMRYGQPSLPTRVAALHAQGVRHIQLLPLYPQYSTTTTLSVLDVVARLQREYRDVHFDVINDYHRHPAWVAAIADSIRNHWARHGRGDRLLLSFHGIPEACVRKGDPYADQCEASTAAIADTLGLARDAVTLSYQSRFGRAKWLSPSTLDTLLAWGREGVARVDVVCPGFAVDCLETLEEIAETNAQAFTAAGGTALHYIPCLNADDVHADALARIALEHSR